MNKKAIEYAERYGIVQYRVKDNCMIYNKSYPAYLNNSRYTIQFIVNLDTMESKGKMLKKFMKDGLYNTR